MELKKLGQELKKIVRHPTTIVFIIFVGIVLIANSYYSSYIKDIYPYKDPGIYGGDFFMGILVNVNSSIIDFFVLGIIVFFIDLYRRNRDRLSESQQRLSDYSTHSSTELNLTKLTLIKEIINSQEEINLDSLALEGITLRGLEFNKHTLTGLNLSRCTLIDCVFNDCNLKAIILNDVKVKNVVFERCILDEMKAIDGNFDLIKIRNSTAKNSNFRRSKFKQAEIIGCDVENCEFTNADLERAKISHLSNVNFEELVKAKNLNYLIADISFVNQLQAYNSNIRR